MRTCIVCQSDNLTLSSRSHHYQLFRCHNCDLVFSDSKPQTNANWYQENVQYTNYNLNPFKYGLTWGHQQFLHQIAPYLDKQEPLLDYACGNGLFLWELQRQGFQNLYGFDFDPNALASCQRLGLRNCVDRLERLPPKKFACVTAFEILEHVESPTDLIRKIWGLLSEDGLLALSIPNRERHPDTIPPQIEQPPHHLTYWNKIALPTLLQKNNFEVKILQEKKFDLSEPFGFMRLQLTKPLFQFPRSSSSRSVSQQPASERSMHIKNFLVNTLNVLLFPIFTALIYLFGFKGHSLFAVGKKFLPSPD